ncbi:MAG: hypothetical protein BGO39_24705 [Chloroflexi bacterium 54-19]|nr:MAG: hypothetical protein BGO39_24705 [Chloroflexi bacterium 54-19]
MRQVFRPWQDCGFQRETFRLTQVLADLRGQEGFFNSTRTGQPVENCKRPGPGRFLPNQV